jgi:hypothetical protein
MATFASVLGCALLAVGLWGSVTALWREGAR